MSDIKIRNVLKGTIKTLDKGAVAGERVKNAYIRTRENAEQSVSPEEGSVESEAAEQLAGGAKAVGRRAVHPLGQQSQKAVKSAKKHFSAMREQKRRTETVREAVRRFQKPVSFPSDVPVKPPMQTLRWELAARKTVTGSGKHIKQKAMSTSDAAIKTAGRRIKTAQRSVKNAGQTVRTAAKTTQKTAQAAKATVKAVAIGIKATVKATIAAVKAIIAATKALIAAIAAGGWVAVVVIIVICLIGLIVGSCFGIFFSNEDSGSGLTMQSVVQEINDNYQQQIDTIKANISYDVLELSGSRAVWPEALAVYAVKTTTDPDNAQEVATMDDSKKTILKDIFWQMNQIFSRTETNDSHGNIVETKTTVTRTYLYITVSHKTAEEMADQYHFSADQRKQLAELLADENRSMWSAVLYGIGTGDGEIVTVALSQIGNVGGEPYWS